MPARYGVGELYGYDFSSLNPDQIRRLSRSQHNEVDCPFKPKKKDGSSQKCTKRGGTCSLRLYTIESGAVIVSGDPVTTCPNRFLESGLITRWVGETLLGTSDPIVITQVPFLMGWSEEQERGLDAVGKIDMVLVYDAGTEFRWCALEMQAVYFSGGKMENDFQVMREWSGPGLPCPQAQRRPDFRSSGPKRLMPQLQIKVPTISRWGKKMAVVVDKAFWQSLREMRRMNDISNCEIVWFVVSFAPGDPGRFMLTRHETYLTTLDHAVEGLTGGTPVSLEHFENEIRSRLSRS